MDVNLGVVAEGNYQAARRGGGDKDPFVYGGGSNERYLNLDDEASLGIFAKRITHLRDGGGDESTVEHVFYTAAFDRGNLQRRDLFVAIVVTDVGISADTPATPGIEFVNNIQLLLGQTRFLALGLGIDTKQKYLDCPADLPTQCTETIVRALGLKNQTMFGRGILLPNKAFDFSEGLRLCAEEHGFASPRLLEDFSRGSGGRFVNICNKSYLPAVESFTDRIFRAAKCHLLM